MRLRDRMPELDGATAWLNGRTSKRELLGVKPTLIHFWSVSCHLCKEVMPEINEFRDRFRNDLHVVAVHMPRSEKDLDIDEVEEVADEHNITQPIFIDNEMKLTNAFNNQHVPAYYVFDKDGQLRHMQAGGSGLKMLEKRVKRVLDEMRRA